jgi:hypothetical protein
MGKKKTDSRVLSAGNFMIPVSSVPTVQSAVNVVSQSPPTSNINLSMNPALQMGGVDPFSQMIMMLNTNPYLVAIFMLVLNLGGRFLALELTKKQELFLQQAWIRPLIFFTVIFVATRNLVVAFWVTLLFFFVIWIVANENSPYCMIPSWCGHNTPEEKEKYEKNIKKI